MENIKYVKRLTSVLNEGETSKSGKNDKDESKNFYAKFWVSSLEKEFGETKIDKLKKIKPLYGGGDYVFVGYEVKLDDKKFNKFILEGIAMNGMFMKAAIILFKGDTAIMHGSIDFDYNFNKTKLDDNIDDVIKAIKAKIKEQKIK